MCMNCVGKFVDGQGFRKPAHVAHPLLVEPPRALGDPGLGLACDTGDLEAGCGPREHLGHLGREDRHLPVLIGTPKVGLQLGAFDEAQGPVIASDRDIEQESLDVALTAKGGMHGLPGNAGLLGDGFDVKQAGTRAAA